MSGQNNNISDLKTLRNDVYDYVRIKLADGMIDVEADPKHYETALDRAIRVYRTKAQNAHQETFGFLKLENNVQEYTLPQEVSFVRQVLRRTVGYESNVGDSGMYEPFEGAFLNQLILNAAESGGLFTYELYTSYQHQLSRMFGGYLIFTFNQVTKKLVIARRPRGSGEIVLLIMYNLKPDVQLLADFRIRTWIEEYTYSLVKQMIGQARSLFSTIAGPQGGSSLNGAEIKAEAAAEIEKLENDLKLYVDGSEPLGFIIG